MTLGSIHYQPEAFQLHILFHFWKFRLAHFNLIKGSFGLHFHKNSIGKNLVLGVFKKGLALSYSRVPYKVYYENN